MAAVRALGAGHELRQPSRNKLAAVLALFVPRTGIGSGAAAVVSIFMVAVMAAVAIPAYKKYQARAQEAAAMQALTPRDPASTPSGR
jgi:uncharacterized membrane protein YebE (DUF533 family)